MRNGSSWRGLATLSLLLVSIAAHSAVMLEPDDRANGGTPHEIFPLPTRPPVHQEAVRSEAPAEPSEQSWGTLKAKILADFGQRLSAEFQVDPGLRERTSFWFDIYTRYGESHHIVHHVRFPWIVYEVVDTTEMVKTGKGPLWLRRDRANKFAQKRTTEIRKALKRLASRSSYKKLPPLEKELYEKLKAVPGSRKSVLRLAAQSVRSQLGQKDFFERGLINSSRYLPYMEEEFRRQGLPVELTRMPFVESSFNENAYSKVGASGIWQIMPRTGKAYMIVSETIDERNSPLKATAAAAKLLRSYHRALKSWPLAITSYNHGIGNIQKAIRMGRSRDLATIISRYHDGDFKFASSNFYTCFLAALYAEKYHELIFKNVPREPLQEIEEIRLAGKTRARFLTKVTGLDRDELLKYNLDLRGAVKSNSFVPRGFRLHVPAGLKNQVAPRIGIQEKKSTPRT